MKEAQMEDVADLIFSTLVATKPAHAERVGEISKAKIHIDLQVLHGLQERSLALLEKFPLYPEIILD
jgi:hypothetical protein